MRHPLHQFWALAVAAVSAAPGFAQTAPPSSASTASGPELGYRSTLDGYQRFTDQAVGSWRDANDNVGRIGGWRTYAKEARQPEGPTAPAARPASVPAQVADPHAEHGKQ